MKNKKGYLLCRKCSYYKVIKEYYSGELLFYCKWNSKHKEKVLKCNKENNYFAFVKKNKNKDITRHWY